MHFHTLPTLPDRQMLRALYDAAISEVNTTRSNVDLTTGFYAETGNAVFEAGYLALSDYSKGPSGPHRLHTVSAPAGGGKTSYSYALMLALTKYAEQTPSAPYGCVFVVDQIPKADEAFIELHALAPGKVAVWTTEHDPRCKNRTRVPHPAAEFTKEQLRQYPIIIVTHAFYNGKDGNKAHIFVRDKRVQSGRALTVVDERPEEVEHYEITLMEAQGIREKLEAKRPDIRDTLDKLMRFIMSDTLGAVSGVIMRASDHLGQEVIANQLNWFTSNEAEGVVSHHSKGIPGLDRLFGFARAFATGCAFAVKIGQVVQFVGWQRKIKLRPGMILLDATADIDGVSLIVPWRQHTRTPQAHYGNLEIVHVPQHTKKRLSEYLKKAANQRAYVDWMVQTIKQHMAPAERGLVVCKKALFDAERVPQWTEGDPRFKEPESYGERYEWDIEGRELCATHYGTGIGSNVWKEADVVFLFDEFFLPRRIAVASVQGLRGQKANEGDLASMRTLSSKAPGWTLIEEGHRLRWTKQMALRGRGRSYDQHGVCGKQRLVISSDLKSFMANASKLFPGANIRTAGVYSKTTRVALLIEILSNPDLPSKLTTKDISRLIEAKTGKRTPWRVVSSNVLTEEFSRSLDTLGWRYVPGKGRGGSHFERTQQIITQAA
jgi:hypothetical protein